MAQLLEKPAGSIIEERHEPGELILIWKLPTRRLVRLPTAIFLLFWLGGWSVGWFVVFTIIVGGGLPWFAIIFLCCWLGAWTAGGIYAFAVLRVLFRPTRSECISLGFDSFLHDPGWSYNPFTGVHSFSNYVVYWKEIFKSRRPIQVPKAELKSFILDHVGERQRLAFDCGANRIEIGAELREPEREWLFQVLEAWRIG